jgi:hypothetical protein
LATRQARVSRSAIEERHVAAFGSQSSAQCLSGVGVDSGIVVATREDNTVVVLGGTTRHLSMQHIDYNGARVAV